LSAREDAGVRVNTYIKGLEEALRKLGVIVATPIADTEKQEPAPCREDS
jgi:hypothetical protein